MVFEAIVGLDDPRRAALGRNRVATHRIDLRDHGDRQVGILLADSDGRPQTSTAPAQDYDIVNLLIRQDVTSIGKISNVHFAIVAFS